jgi:hypothetical protein
MAVSGGKGYYVSKIGKGHYVITATPIRKAKKQIKEFPITTPTPFPKSRFLFPK